MEPITSKSGKMISLRQIDSADANLMFDYITEIGLEDTFIFINPDSMETFESEEKYVQHCVNQVANKKMVKLLAFNGELLVGVADICKLDKRQQHLGRFGITLRKPYRGEGIGKALVLRTIDLAKRDLGISKVILGCFANNQIGLSLYKSLGFEEYGRMPEGVLYKGEYIDEVLMYKDLN